MIAVGAVGPKHLTGGGVSKKFWAAGVGLRPQGLQLFLQEGSLHNQLGSAHINQQMSLSLCELGGCCCCCILPLVPQA
jgi:hypothetical protein